MPVYRRQVEIVYSTPRSEEARRSIDGLATTADEAARRIVTAGATAGRGLETIGQAAARSAGQFATFGKSAQNSAAAMSAAIDRLDRDFDQLRLSLDPATRALREFETAQETARRAVQFGAATQEEANRVVALAAQRYQVASAAIVQQGGRAAVTGRNLGNTMQQAGFQVGDFAVQVASGQGALRAFIQQGTQLISFFGPWGAVLGAAGAVVGALAVGLTSSGAAAGEAEGAFEAYNRTLQRTRGISDEAAGAARNLAGAHRDAAVAALESAQAEAVAAQDLLNRQVRAQQAYVDALRVGAQDGGLAGSPAELREAQAELDRLTEQFDRNADAIAGIDSRLFLLRDTLAKVTEGSSSAAAAQLEHASAIDVALSRLEDQVVETENAILTFGLEEEAVARVQAEQLILNAIREDGAQLTDAQRERLDLLLDQYTVNVQRLRELRAAKEANAQADRVAAQAAEQAARALAESQRAFDRVIDRIASNAQEKLGDILYDHLRDETLDFAEFLKKTLLRALADIAAAAATQKIVIPIATSVVGAVPGLFGVTGQAAGVAQSAGGGFGNILSAGSSLNSIFGGGASSLASSFATSSLGAALGLSSTVGPATALGVAAVPGGLSAAAGGAAGGVSALTGAGAALTAAAPYIAAAVAAGALLFGGSLFGGSPSVGPTGVARLPNVTGDSAIRLGVDNDGDASAAKQVAQSIRDISTSAAGSLGFFGQRAFGLDVGHFPSPESGNSQAAGFNLKRIIDNVLESQDFEKGLTADAAITLGVRETLQRAFDGVDVPEIATALENSAAETVQDLLAHLDFANLIGTFARGGIDAVDALRRPLTDVEQAFKDLAKAAEAGTDQARDLGLSVNTTTEYFAALRQQLEEQTQAGFTAQIRALSGQGFLNDVQSLLDVRGQNAASAVAAGLDQDATAGTVFNLALGQVLSQLTADQRALVGSTFGDQQVQDVLDAFAAANDNATSALAAFSSGLAASLQAIDAQTSAVESQIGQWQGLGDTLAGGRIARALNADTSILSFTARLNVAEDELNRVRGLALGGDQNAIRQFDSAGDAAIQQAIALYGTNDARTIALYNGIQADSQTIQGLTVSQIDLAQSQLDELRAIREQLAGAGGEQDLGFNPVRNRILAQLTDYQGDFDGAGAFQSYIANQNFPPALRELIASVSSSIGFNTGGSFTVGGAGGVDRNLVMFRASLGEHVSVSRRDNMADVAAGLSAVVGAIDRLTRVVIAGEELSGEQRRTMASELGALKDRLERVA